MDRTLEDKTVPKNLISWGPRGDHFAVKNVDEFAKSLLPRMFKHCNFASFVRQLNKYGFRKIKILDDDDEKVRSPFLFGSGKIQRFDTPQSWTFKHPNFHAGGRNAVDNIKRKSPHHRYSNCDNSATSPLSVHCAQPVFPFPDITSIQAELLYLDVAHEDILFHVRNLERNLQDVLAQMGGFQRWIAQQDGIVHSLMCHLRDRNVHVVGECNPHDPFPSHVQGRTPQLHDQGGSLLPFVQETTPPDFTADGVSTSTKPSDFDLAALGMLNGPNVGGCGWAAPPHVLVVDDDAVCRLLSSKFLQVLGCSIDIAVDGVGAVNKMNENREKYDLVLMDIAMPNLDGVSASAMIRNFDTRTPIISMTSKARPNELWAYHSSGMNDILAKPFTKEGLFAMLEVCPIFIAFVCMADNSPLQKHLGQRRAGVNQNVCTSRMHISSAAPMRVPPPSEMRCENGLSDQSGPAVSSARWAPVFPTLGR
ncbi:hypothetical protein DFH06DRAFT_1006579 [Mycena polygramma]|nr:hypothetical protein DFH06DRAFT_1006579 [Mycena polygramma]